MWITPRNRATLGGMMRSALILCGCLLVAADARPCTIVADEAHPRPTPHSLVRDADAIVVATAVRTALSLTGRLVDVDDFNHGAAPYASPRDGALTGACFAYEYRTGASYLLFLKRSRSGTLTPYWAALQPVNEQLHDSADPWLRWVREQVAVK